MSEAIIPIRIEFTYVYEDYFPSVAWHRLFTLRKIAGWLIVLGLGVLAFIAFRRPPAPEAEAGGRGYALADNFLLFLGISAAIVLFYRYRRMSRKKWESTYPQQPWVMTFSQSHILIETPALRTEMQWTAFNRFEETDRWFVLHSIENHPLHLPARAIPAERVDDLRKLIAAQLSRSGGFPVQLKP